MKNIQNILVASIFFIMSSCGDDYNDTKLQDRINKLENQIWQIEKLCQQMNSNINSLQIIVLALQEKDYITGVLPVVQENEIIGYTISFTKDKCITIYHGKDGNNGDTPQISIRKYTDGLYYWTLDGVWLRDTSGNMVIAQGENGLTPRMKIEDGYWWVFYGLDEQWIKLDKAIVESESVIIKEITSDADKVYFTLLGGEVMTLPKYKKMSVEFAEGNELLFDENESKEIHYTINSDMEVVVKAELLNNDNSYTLHTNVTSETSGTLVIKANQLATNQIIVSVSNGECTITSAINVASKPLLDAITIYISEAGTLPELLKKYDGGIITTLKIVGLLNESDIINLKNLKQLSILDLEDVNLECLPAHAFWRNHSLECISLPKMLKGIDEFAFSSCDNLNKVLIPSSVTTIGQSAFSNCSNLKEVNISLGVCSIGYAAFKGCSSLKNVNIPSSVTTLGESAFSSCSSLSEITIPSSVTIIGRYAFERCYSLKEVSIPLGLTAIEQGTFEDCNKLNEVNIPSSVTTIGQSALRGCTGLSKISIPSSVNKIEDWAFCECSSLKEINIPLGVTVIGQNAFKGCNSLSEVTIPSGINRIEGWTFYECRSLKKVTFSKYSHLTTIGGAAFYGCSSLEEIIFPPSLNTIEGTAFGGCSSLEEIALPSSLTTIESTAFCDCSSLRELVIPSSVTAIYDGAFSGCSNLSKVVIDAPINTIESKTFYKCSRLKDVHILSDNITLIGELAFYGCDISEFIIPSHVTSIEYAAFYGCKNLSSIYCKALVPPSIDRCAFSNCEHLYVPETAIGRYSRADEWGEFKKIEGLNF